MTSNRQKFIDLLSHLVKQITTHNVPMDGYPEYELLRLYDLNHKCEHYERCKAEVGTVPSTEYIGCLHLTCPHVDEFLSEKEKECET